MPRSAQDVVDDYYGKVTAGVARWVDHLGKTRDLTKKIVSGGHSSWQQMFSEILANGIECYDTAYGWMYPGNPTSTKSGSNPTGGTPGGRAPTPSGTGSVPTVTPPKKRAAATKSGSR